MAVTDGGRDEGANKRILGPNAEIFEVNRLQEQATYQFWVTASTAIGEGEKSKPVVVAPNNKVPARIVSFSRNVVTAWKQDLVFHCKKVGVPPPVTIWRQDGAPLEPNTRKVIAKNGTLTIKDSQHGDSGNYTCSVENTWGRDEITYRVLIKIPPAPPNLSVVSSYADSLQLEWTDNYNGGSQILGKKNSIWTNDLVTLIET